MKTKHTQGKWMFKKWNGEEWPEKKWSIGSKGTAICISPKYFTDGEESEANAKLIAASPELLQALNYLVNDLERNDGDLENRAILIKEAKQVIKKATE